MSNDSQFDPYHKWLGIHPDEHPVDHYRLLGVVRFETDAESINTVAEQRMAYIRGFQSGPRGQLTQQLLNELTAAKRTLLDPQLRAEYDASLQSQLMGSRNRAAAPPAAEPVARPAPRNAPAAAPAPPPYPQPLDTQPAVAQPTAPAPGVIPPANLPQSSPPTAAGPANPAATPALAPEAAHEEANNTPLYMKPWFPPVVAVGLLLLISGFLFRGKLFGSADEQVNANLIEDPPNAVSDTDPAAQNDPTLSDPNEDVIMEESEPEAVVVMQEADGTIVLPLSVAQFHGEAVSLTTANGQEVIGNWSNTDDWISWQFKALKIGFFKLEVVYSAAPESAGGVGLVGVDEDFAKEFTVRAPDSPGETITDYYYVTIKRTGEHTLSLQCVSKPADELFTLRSIKLLPARIKDAGQR